MFSSAAPTAPVFILNETISPFERPNRSCDGGPVDAALHAHMRDCNDCTARLAATVEMRERLRAYRVPLPVRARMHACANEHRFKL